MRNLVLGISMTALAAAASAQAPAPAPEPAATWEFFEEDGGRNGALVKAADGSQLILKCDKPGRREVHAIVLAPSEKLAVPNDRPMSRPIRFQFDGGAPKTESWGYYEHHAIAQGKTSDRALARFIAGLRGTSDVKMRLDTGIGPDVDLEFGVAGSEAAIARVYKACNDSEPS